jgi:hypothetical protein
MYTYPSKSLVGAAALIFILLAATPLPGLTEEDALKTYVGSETCQGCHEDEFDSFTAYAKKATSYDSITVMAKGLTPAEIKACYACHTTGYGAPGGFISDSETPHLKNAGCEVCHGPGSLHVESEDSDDIIAELSIDACKACHRSDRVEAFKFRPLLHGGAH